MALTEALQAMGAGFQTTALIWLPVSLWIMSQAKHEIINKMKLKWMSRKGYGRVRIIQKNRQEKEIILPMNKPTVSHNGMTWNCDVARSTFEGKTPILTVDVDDSEPIDLVELNNNKEDKFDPAEYQTVIEMSKMLGALAQSKDDQRVTQFLYIIMGGIAITIFMIMRIPLS